MADRFLVATGVYSSTAIWSASSGGAGGASVPGAADTIIVDPNSNGFTCTFDQAASVTALDMQVSTTGIIDTSGTDYAFTTSGAFSIAAGTFTANGSSISVGGDCLISGGTVDFGTSTVDLTASGNLTNPSSATAFYHLKVGPASGTTTLTGDVYTRTLEGGAGVLTQATTSDDMFIGTGLTVGGDLKVVTAHADFMIDNSGGGDDLDFVFGMTSGSYAMDGFDGDLALDISPATACGATIKLVTRSLDAERLDMSTSTCTFDFNGQSATIASVDSGTTNASSILCGEGILDFGLWVSDNADGTIDLESATIQMGSDFRMRTAGMTIVNGTSTMNFDDPSGDNEIQLQGESLDTVNVTGGATWTLLDAFACAAFSITAGSFNDGGFAMTVAGLVSINTSGTFTGTGSLVQTGDGNFTYADNGTYAVSSQDIVLQGTGSVTIAKAGVVVANITCAAAGKVTTISSTTYPTGWSDTLTLGTGTLTVNAQFYWISTSALTPIVNAGATINGASNLVLVANHAAPSTISLAALTMTGTTTLKLLHLAGDAVVTYNMTGAISAPIIFVQNSNNHASSGTTLTTNDYAFTASTDFSWGNSAASGAVVLNMGASTVSIGTYCATSYNAGAGTANMGTSAWACTGGAWTTQSNQTVSVSSWSLDLNGSGIQDITSAGEPFATVDVTGTSTVELQDAFACAAFSMTAGSFNDGGFVVTVVGLISFNTSGTYTLSGTWTQTGDADFMMADAGTQVLTGWSLILLGTGILTLRNYSTGPDNLTCAASGKTTTLASATVHGGIKSSLTVGSGTLTNSMSGSLYLHSFSGTAWTVDGSATMNGGSTYFLYFNNTAPIASCIIPTLSMTNGLSIAKEAGAGTVTVDFGGSISCGTFRCWIKTGGVGSLTLNTNDLSLTCGILSWGSTTAGLTITLNMGASVVACTSYNTVYVANAVATQTINMGTSQWACAGAWAFQSNHTVNEGTSTVDFNGSGTQDITSAGKSFATVDITGTSVVEIQDAFVCTNFTLITGTFDTNSVGNYGMTVITFDMNGGTFNANGSAIGVGGNCTIDGGTADFGTSTLALTASGNLTNGTSTNSFNQLTQSGSIVTTLTNLVYVDNLTCGAGSTIQTDGTDRDLRVQTSLVVSTVTWSSNGADLKLWFEKDGAVTFPGDDYGDVSLHFRRDGTTLTFGGDVTTTGLVRAFSKTNNTTGTMVSDGYNLTCGELQMGVSGATNRGARLLMEGTSVVTVNGNCTIFEDNGTANNRLAWSSGNTGTSAITGNLVVQALAELDWISVCTHVLKVGGDVTFDATSVIDENEGTIELNGSGAQAIDFGSQALNDVAVTNTGGTVSFTTAPIINGVFAPGNGASTITIRQSTTGTTHWGSIDTSAASGTGTVDINSIGEVASWALTIGSNQTITSVDVTYSNLTGFTIDATDATNVDGGNNSVNWVFAAVAEFFGDHATARGVARGVAVGVG